MRCYICDSILSTEATQWNSDHEEWDPCPTCLTVIADVFSDPLDEDEITYLLEKEEDISLDGLSTEDIQEESSP